MVSAQDQEEKNGREKEEESQETGSSNFPWRPGLGLRKRDAPVVLWHVRILSGRFKHVFEYERATFERLKFAIDQGLQGVGEGLPSGQGLPMPRAHHVVLSQNETILKG